MSLILLFSATMYFANYSVARGFFEELGYPVYLIYPLAVLKILAVLTFLLTPLKQFREVAYSAVFFELLLALSGHIMAGHGASTLALVAFISCIISYWMHRSLNPSNPGIVDKQ